MQVPESKSVGTKKKSVGAESSSAGYVFRTVGSGFMRPTLLPKAMKVCTETAKIGRGSIATDL